MAVYLLKGVRYQRNHTLEEDIFTPDVIEITADSDQRAIQAARELRSTFLENNVYKCCLYRVDHVPIDF